ncbi:hypothetical protein AB1Y20_001640 [Prymnesium parvum]|uniref:Uncharacterized protein n=1 Tax=Prymnesium parvum TaxID=97485 RepID=A0AB34KCL2_PRYPA
MASLRVRVPQCSSERPKDGDDELPRDKAVDTRRKKLASWLAALLLLSCALAALRSLAASSQPIHGLLSLFPTRPTAASSAHPQADGSLASDAASEPHFPLPTTRGIPHAEAAANRAWLWGGKAWLPDRDAEAVEKARRSLSAQSLLPVGGAAGDAFLLGVRAETGTLEVVSPVSLPDFSYTLPLRDDSVRLHWAGSGRHPLPLDRTGAGFHHLGDLTLRLRRAGSGERFTRHSTVAAPPWKDPLATLAAAPSQEERGARGERHTSLRVDASALLRPAHASLRVHRELGVRGAEVTLRWTLSNAGAEAIEVGGLGLSMPFNQMFSGRQLPQVARRCSFTEVYVGGDAGYVQVTRTTGQGPVLLVLPAEREAGRPSSGFEGWRPLKWEDRANYDWMHEMLYEVMVHTAAYAAAEWKDATPWAAPTAATIGSGQNLSYGVRLRLAEDVESVNSALLHAGVPVCVPLPAAAFHLDMESARLELLLPQESTCGSGGGGGARWRGVEGKRLRSVTHWPKEAMASVVTSEGEPVECGREGCAGPHLVVALKPRMAGRCRVTLAYADERGEESHQLVHLMVMEPPRPLLQKYADFSMRKAWLPANVTDPWSRAPSFLGTDAEEQSGGTPGSKLIAEERVFMAGLSDESGAAAHLAMAMKQLGLPVKAEVEALEEFVHLTLWAGKDGERRRFLQGKDYSVRLSMLYWSDSIDKDAAAHAVSERLYKVCHKCWPKCYWMHCWSEEHSLETWRAYNYPHVAAVYWSLYRLGRHYSPPLTSRADWKWYLEQAGRTAIAMSTFGGRGTAQWGLMVGSVFQLVLRDLKREGFTKLAEQMTQLLQRRMAKWLSMEFPYGSEFPWDSTGHEEIHTWLLQKQQYAAANKTVQAVLAYSSVLPHWGYCGSSRRYWDFTINGKTQWGNERELHHYGATLNAIPLLDSFKAFPRRAHLLKLGGCALLGHLTNIHPSGAASMAWHGDPGLLRRDGYSGDYGIGLYGYWRSASSYLACVMPHGWLCVMCDVNSTSFEAGGMASACADKGPLRIVPREPFGRKLYLAPLGTSFTVEGASIVHADFWPSVPRLRLRLLPYAAAPSREATLIIDAESVEPPPRYRPREYQVTCDAGADSGCVRAAEAAAPEESEHTIRLRGPTLHTTVDIQVKR